MNGKNSLSLSSNIFKEEVNEGDIIFDIKEDKPKSIADELSKAKEFSLETKPFRFNIKPPTLPQLPDVNLPDINIAGPPTPQIDFDFPDIPQIDFKSGGDSSTGGGGPNFNEAINVVRDAAVSTGERVSEIAEPLAEPLSDIGEVLSDTAEGVSVKRGDGDGFGEVSGPGDVVLDFSDKIEDAFAKATKGSQLEGVAAEDVYNAATDPLNFVKNKGLDEAVQFLESNTGLSGIDARDISNFINDPEEFAKNQSLEQVANIIATNLPVGESGAVAVAESLRTLISTGDPEAAARIGAQALAMEVGFQAANAILPGSGEVLRVVIALGLEDDIADVLSSGAAAAGDVIAEPLAKQETAFEVAETVGDIVDFGEDVADVVVAPFEAIKTCNLITAAYVDGLTSKESLFNAIRFRMHIQKHEPMADAFWSGYVLMTSNISNRIGKKFYNFVTKPWIRHIEYKIGEGPFTLSGAIVMGAMRVGAIITYLFNKREAKKLQAFFRQNSIMGVYRKMIREVERGTRSKK